MSNNPEKKKRGYMVDGVRLAKDCRVRLTAEDAERLAEYAKKFSTTRAAAARALLHDALHDAMNPEK